MLLKSRLLRRLFDSLSGRIDALNEVSPAEWQEILETSNAHSVQPMLAHRLLSSNAAVPERIRTTLRAIQRQTVERNMRRYRDFALAVRALGDIPVIALKGVHLMGEVYDSLAVRSMLDIDLLVRGADLHSAGAALQRLGYEPSQPYRIAGGDSMPLSFHHHLPPFLKPGASVIELHWHIVPPRYNLAIDIGELWQRAVPARIAGVDVRVLSSEDLLLHLCAHATYDHRCRVSVRACCDIAQVARRLPISWMDVVERATRWGTASGTYVALRLARELLDAAIPADVLEALAPADFDDRLLPAAIREPADDVTDDVARFLNAGGMRAKLAILWDRLFVPRDFVAENHALRRSSFRVYPFYAVRAVQLVKKYWRFVIGLESGERRRAAAESAAAIEAMLARKAK